eukprot:EG_transcript_22060
MPMPRRGARGWPPIAAVLAAVCVGLGLGLLPDGPGPGGVPAALWSPFAPRTAAAPVAPVARLPPSHAVQRVGHTVTVPPTPGLDAWAAEGAGQRSAASAVPLALVGFAAALALWVAAPTPTPAFENAIPEAAKWATEPKRPGTQAADLGLLPRSFLEGRLGLKECRGPPNCFSTSGPAEDNAVAPWLPPAGRSAEAAVAELRRVVEQYPPGQLTGLPPSWRPSPNAFLLLRSFSRICL